MEVTGPAALAEVTGPAALAEVAGADAPRAGPAASSGADSRTAAATISLFTMCSRQASSPADQVARDAHPTHTRASPAQSRCAGTVSGLTGAPRRRC